MMLSIEMRHAVTRFAATDGYLASPEGCENMCGTISRAFARRCLVDGISTGLLIVVCSHPVAITRFDRRRLSSNHVALAWDRTVIDFTARQFWPATPFPLIEPLEAYRLRFDSIGTGPIRLPDVDHGPSRMARRDVMRRKMQHAH